MDGEPRFDEKWVGLPEVADVLGLHRATVNDWVRRRRLKARRRGAHWFVLRSDLEALAADYSRPRNAPPRRESPILPTSAPRIVELLREFGSASALELAPLLDLHEGNVRKHLRLMEHEGLVRRQPDGQWLLNRIDCLVGGA